MLYKIYNKIFLKITKNVNSCVYIIAGIKDVTVDHAFSHLGKCQGIVNIIRGIPYNTKSGRISIPHDILLKNNVSYENIIRNSSEQNVRDAIFEISSRANSHLMKVYYII